jgi:hypothetical protein
VHDIAHADDLLTRFRGDDTLACGHKQHLIAAMDVHLVPRFQPCVKAKAKLI